MLKQKHEGLLKQAVEGKTGLGRAGEAVVRWTTTTELAACTKPPE